MVATMTATIAKTMPTAQDVWFAGDRQVGQ